MNEHRFITFLICSKQVQKDSSLEDEVEEQASPLREERQMLLSVTGPLSAAFARDMRVGDSGCGALKPRFLEMAT